MEINQKNIHLQIRTAPQSLVDIQGGSDNSEPAGALQNGTNSLIEEWTVMNHKNLNRRFHATVYPLFTIIGLHTTAVQPRRHAEVVKNVEPAFVDAFGHFPYILYQNGLLSILTFAIIFYSCSTRSAFVQQLIA